MKYAIISDIHANIAALEAVFAEIEAIGVDDVICLGDVVGYGKEPNECIDSLRLRGIRSVMGHYEAIACGLEQPYGFNARALQAVTWLRESLRPDNLSWLRSLPPTIVFDRCLAVHGAPGNRNTYLFTREDVLPHFQQLEKHGCRVCFFGHTHIPGVFSADEVHEFDGTTTIALADDNRYFINVGSVGQARDGDFRPAFGVIDVRENWYRLHRVDSKLASRWPLG